ncbi:hypothetical protein [Gilvimarinus sp. DA14]|uniref:hypothetical protein n=1 Tax=Gilvimarinus sp. DA14 TaxID=2956798 RepID=UPI0020B874C4|nr:hypothetical protein [Gilvimarinus sp. DA14]UTF59440.1 hypothetical protein NHM04_13315 [Gilvimarinus sp. DA14]
MNKKILCLGALCSSLLSEVAFADCDFSDFPTMAEMKVSALMDNAQYNNRPLGVRSFSASVSADSVLGFYQRRWRDRSVQSTFGPWQQIGTMEDECFFTVQYGGAGENSFGRLLISRVPEADIESALGEGVVKPADALVVSDMLTDDGPKKGRVTIITSEQSVSELVSFYRTEMAMDNWSLEQNFSQQGGTVLVFRKGIDENNIVIMPAGDASQILINEVEIN